MSKRGLQTAFAVILLAAFLFAVPAYAEPDATLRSGSEGDRVTLLQNILKQKGYFNDTPTGYFGSVTLAAVKAFQKANGLTADGVVGPLTSEALGLDDDKLTAAAADGITLRPGDRNATVTALQEKLKALGYFTSAVDGSYGAKTTAAVKAYQKAAGLTADGIAGPKTLASFNEDDPSGVMVSGKTLRVGDENDDVKTLQQKLADLGYFKNAVTGYYGSITTAAVKAYQKANNLTADGIAGPKTFASLGLTAPTGDTAKPKLAPVVVRRSVSDLREEPDWAIRGDSGDDVKLIQQRLEQLGYYTYGSITGYFGTVTEEAVKAFQKKNTSLQVSGMVGTRTRELMFSDKAIPASGGTDRSTPTATPKPTAKPKATPKPTTPLADQIIAYAKSFLGTPYNLGSTGPKAFDCSGFTNYVFKHFGYTIPRYAINQGTNNYGTKITGASNLKKGDLVFFNTVDDSDLCDHVGIYIGNGQFIHCSSSTKNGEKVCISNLSTGYYKRVFSWGRRII